MGLLNNNVNVNDDGGERSPSNIFVLTSKQRERLSQEPPLFNLTALTVPALHYIDKPLKPLPVLSKLLLLMDQCIVML